MPLPMVHLIIAKEISERTGISSDYFYLGSLAPDAIHMRTGSDRSDKHKTHFFCQSYVSNAEFVEKNIAAFEAFLTTDNQNYRDFALGYMIHTITDMNWIKTIFNPLESLLRSGGLSFGDVRKLYYEETKANDFALYNTNPYMADILRNLEKTREFGFLDLSAREIKEWKLLTIDKFKNQVQEYTVKPYYITLHAVRKFTGSLVPEIVNILKRMNLMTCF